MSEYLDTIDPWPSGKPLPPKAITILFDPDTNKEYRIETARLDGNGGTPTNYFKEVYTAKASGAQTITSADVPGLDTAVLIASVGVRGVDAQGTVTLDGVSSDNYFLSQGVLTIKTDADIDQDDVLEINFITAGQLAAVGLNATQLDQLLVAGSGISINPTPDGKLLITATVVAAPIAAPRAPTDGQVDDVADTFSFLPNPAYPASAQYKVVGRPGVTGAEQLDATNSYVSGNRIYVKVVGAVARGGLAVYVAGSGSVPDGAALTNAEPFTGVVVTPTPTPDLTAALALSLATLTLGASVSYSVTPAKGTAPYSYEVVATDTATGQQFTLGTTKTGSWTPTAVGSFAIEATVTDSSSPAQVAQSAIRYLQVVQAANRIPVADAGQDVTMQLPTSSIALMGTASDPDQGDTLTYAWRQVTGPNAAAGLPATTLNVVVTGLVAGTYQFGFRSTDNHGAQSPEDYVLVTVDAVSGLTDAINLFGDGNSILHGTTEDDGTNGGYNGIQEKIPANVINRLRVSGRNTAVKYRSIAVPGQRIQEMLGRQTQYMFPLYDATVRYNVLVFLEGGNSMSGLRLDADGVPVGWNTAQEAYDLTKQYCQQAKAKYPNLKIVVCTVLPRGGRKYSHIDQPYYQELLRFQYSALIRLAKANGEPWIDAVADLAADGRVGAPWACENRTYYDSGMVHQTAAGAEVDASIIADATMEACFGIAQPAPFPIPNVVVGPAITEETASTRRRVGPFQQYSDNNAFSNVTAQAAPGAADGSVHSTEAFYANRADLFGTKSENGGRFHILLDGFKVKEDTAKTEPGVLLKDQLYYSTGILADGLYQGRHVARKVFLDGFGFDDRNQYFAGSGAQIVTPKFTATPGPNSATLEWGSAGAGATYLVEQSKDSNFGSGVTTVYGPGGTDLTQTVAGLTNRVPYFFRLTATLKGSSVVVLVKVTPSGSTVKPTQPIDLTNVTFRHRTANNLTVDAGNNVSAWGDEYNNLNFAISNETFNFYLNRQDVAFNNNDAVLALGDDELEAAAPAVANLDTFSCYAVFGTPTAASQTLLTNRISAQLNGGTAPKFWTLRSSSFRDATGEYKWTLPVIGAVTAVGYFVSPTRVLVVDAYGDTLYDSGTTAPVDRTSGNIGRIVNGAEIENGAYVNRAVISEAELLGFTDFHANDRARILNTLANLRAAYAI